MMHELMSFVGIWTKHLKAKTELHQTVIDRCLKSLVQKQLVKAIKAVRVRLAVQFRFFLLLISSILASNAQDLHARTLRTFGRANRWAVVHRQ